MIGFGTNGSVPSHRYRFVVLAIGLTNPAIIEFALVIVPALYAYLPYAALSAVCPVPNTSYTIPRRGTMLFSRGNVNPG